MLREDGSAFLCLHWMSVWKANPKAVAKLHSSDFPNIVGVFWSKPGYGLINLFTGTTMCGAGAATAGRGYLGAGR